MPPPPRPDFKLQGILLYDGGLKRTWLYVHPLDPTSNIWCECWLLSCRIQFNLFASRTHSWKGFWRAQQRPHRHPLQALQPTTLYLPNQPALIIVIIMTNLNQLTSILLKRIPLIPYCWVLQPPGWPPSPQRHLLQHPPSPGLLHHLISTG